MAQLNPQQQQAIKKIDGPLLVLAGAGSGKTRVIIEKIAYLIEHCGYLPQHILAVTFTNKAAKEMKSRLSSRLTQQQNRRLKISTFHTYGLNLLKKYGQKLGLRTNFSLFDSQDSLALIHDIAYQQFQSTKQTAIALQQQISMWKNARLLPNQINEHNTPTDMQQAQSVYEAYQYYLNAYNAVDFDDLILLPTQLFEQFPEIQENCQKQARYILIDEYQDTNESQYQLFKQLVSKRQHFTVVGDDDQSIYTWRGARPENMATLKQHYPTLTVIKLEQNYRSSGMILQATNQLIAQNPHLFEKRLWSDLGQGTPIRVMYTQDEKDEAHQISTDLIAHHVNHQTRYGDYAILVRSNHQIFLLERFFQQYKIPYVLSGGRSFFSKMEIKDILAYCKLLTNPTDDRAFLRVINTPRREIGAKTIQTLTDYAHQRQCSLWQSIDEFGLKHYLAQPTIEKLSHFKQLIHQHQYQFQCCQHPSEQKQQLLSLVQGIDYYQWLVDNSTSIAQANRRFDQIQDLLSWLVESKNTTDQSPLDRLADTINRLLLVDMLDQDDLAEQHDQVHILTVHAAKGLEYPNVYIMGFEEGIFPHQQSIEDACVQEERRLAYVAMTRARYRLTLTLTQTRKRFNEVIKSLPSRFLEELPFECLQTFGKTPTTESQRQATAKTHLAQLKKQFGQST